MSGKDDIVARKGGDCCDDDVAAVVEEAEGVLREGARPEGGEFVADPRKGLVGEEREHGGCHGGDGALDEELQVVYGVDERRRPGECDGDEPLPLVLGDDEAQQRLRLLKPTIV